MIEAILRGREDGRGRTLIGRDQPVCHRPLVLLGIVSKYLVCAVKYGLVWDQPVCHRRLVISRIVGYHL